MKFGAFLALSLLFVSSQAWADASACRKVARQAEDGQILLNPPASHKVVGEGRLYFHVAPHPDCRSRNVFVIPGDELVAYSEFNNWYSVMYANPKTGKDYDGWVESRRLKMIGTVRPRH